MWSGPRNLSTALMYAFAARGDFAVLDEPFYAPYLAASGADHPMRDAILAAHETDPADVARTCATAPGAPHLYMKHMPHHMLEGFPLEFMAGCHNVFLIRHPARVIASYAAKRENPTLADLGFAQQAALFDREADRLGHPPPVIDSADIRADPEAALRRLCGVLDLPFRPAMLRWSPGPRPFDGVWAAHWYPAVHRSTGFEGVEGEMPALSPDHRALVDAALPHYERMRAEAL
jgi:hypothetical protein